MDTLAFPPFGRLAQLVGRLVYTEYVGGYVCTFSLPLPR